MNALSRREEDTLLKATKARALKECDALVKDFAECTSGRGISLIWACRKRYREVQDCMYRYTRQESMDELRAEYVHLRDERKAQEQAAQSKKRRRSTSTS